MKTQTSRKRRKVRESERERERERAHIQKRVRWDQSNKLSSLSHKHAYTHTNTHTHTNIHTHVLTGHKSNEDLVLWYYDSHQVYSHSFLKQLPMLLLTLTSFVFGYKYRGGKEVGGIAPPQPHIPTFYPVVSVFWRVKVPKQAKGSIFIEQVAF